MSQSKQHAITLWSPQLLNDLRIEEAQEALKKLSLPALQTLLAKGDSFAVKPQSFYEQACYLFHQPITQPIAATLAYHDLAQFDKAQFWLSVDPVQMVPDRDTLVLIPNELLQITEQESQDLLTSFNEHFSEDRVELQWGCNNRWYLSILQPVPIVTTDLDSMAYQSVNDLYPQGNAAQYWRQLINEAQMLFYSHPVNERRREQGLPEINSIWVWGEGQIDSAKVHLRKDAIIWSKQPYLQGLAKLTESNNQAVPESYQAWLDCLQQDELQDSNKHLLHFDSITENLANLELEQWIRLLEALEESWFKPLLAALKTGEVSSLLLDLGMNYRVHIKTSDLKRFWRFKKPLHRLKKP